MRDPCGSPFWLGCFVPAARAQEARWFQLSEQVVKLQDQGRIAEAVPLAQQAVRTAEATYGPADRHLGLSLNVLGVLLTDQEKFADAETSLQHALAIMNKVSGTESRDAATVMDNLGNLYRLEARYSEAEKLTQQALQIHAKVSGPDDRSVAVDAANLALIYSTEGKYADAEPLYQRAISIDQKLASGANRDLPADLSGLGDLFVKEGKYVDAEKVFVNVLSVDLKILGKDHPQIALDLVNLANTYLYENKFSLAEPVFQRAQAIEATANQLNSATEAQILRGAATLYRREGKYPESEKLQLQALANRVKALGPNHPEVASVLEDLGQTYEDEVRYSDAERAYRQALEIDKKSIGLANLQTARVMVELARLFGSHGQWGAADQMYHDAIPVYQKIYGSADPRVADVVFQAADQLLVESKFNEATSGFTAAAGIYQKAKGDSSPDLARCFDRLASIAEDGRRPDVAESLHKRALGILEKAYGPDGMALTDTLEGLGRIYKEQQKFADAEPLYLRVLKIEQSKLKGNDPGLRDGEADLAALYYVWSKPVQAASYFQAYLENLMNEFRANAATMSERDRLIYFATQRNAFPLFFSFVLKFHDQVPTLTGQMYDALLEQKGLTAESAAAMRAAVVASGDAQAVAMLDKLASEKAQLAAMSESTSADPANHGQQVSQLLQEANTLEQSLMKRSSVVSRQQALNAATWLDVQKQLKPGEAAIEFTRFQFHTGITPTANLVYVALVVTPESQQPAFIVIGEAKDLEAGPMMAFRANVGQARGLQAEAPEQQAGAADPSAAYESFWKPLEPALGSAKRIYVAPDGVLNTIPIGLMQDGAGKLVMEKYQLRIVNSTKDLLRAASLAQSKQAVLVGNPAFGLTVAQQREALVQLNSGAAPDANPETSAQHPDRPAAVASRGGELKGGNLNSLPGTQVEVDSVDKLLKNAGWKAEIYTGDRALKQVVTHVHGPRVMHLATHGFFLTDEQLTATAAAQGKKGESG